MRTPRTYTLQLVDEYGQSVPYDTLLSGEPHEKKAASTFPTRGDARKAGRRVMRRSRFVRFKIDTHLVQRKRRNGTQHPSVAAPSLLKSPRWTGIYRNPDLIQEVVVTSIEEPADERRFRVVGHGSPVFKLVSKTPLARTPARRRTVQLKETDSTMAKTKKKNKKNAKAAEAEVEIDDDVLTDDEELEDLDDLEDVEADEPDDEDVEGDDEDGDLDDLSKKELKARAKEAGVKGFSKLGKDELVTAIQEAESEEDEDDEDDDDEEEVEEKPKKKKGKGKGKQAPPARELPKGKYGVEAIAKAAKVDARTVRVFLRKGDYADKFKQDGRWAFTKKQAQQMAKKVKAAQD